MTEYTEKFQESILTLVSSLPLDSTLTQNIDFQNHFKNVTSLHAKDLNSVPGSAILSGDSNELTIPEWIQPVDLEENFNAALDALVAVEQILHELSTLALAEMRSQVDRAWLAGSSNSDETNAYDELEKRANLQDVQANLELRLINKSVDLHEYTKAVAIGLLYLFGIQVQIPGRPVSQKVNFANLKEMRLFLRDAQIRYRQVTNHECQATVPISTNWCGSQYYVPEPISEGDPYADGAKRNEEGLKKSTFMLDLQNHPNLAELKRPRIRRIGIHLNDLFGGRHRADGTRVNYDIPHRWAVKLADAGKQSVTGAPHIQGLRLNDTLEPFHKIPTLSFFNVIGTRLANQIEWTDAGFLNNFDPCRRWKIEIDRSHADSPTKHVLDVTIIFDLIYQAR